jgi:hypothetical protein
MAPAERTDTAPAKGTRMSEWRKKHDQGFREFRKQGEFTLTCSIIWVGAIPAMAAAADAGDQDARYHCIAIGEFVKSANGAYKDGVSPGCACCGRTIHPGECAGFLIAMPDKAGQTGLCSMICVACRKIDPDELIHKYMDQIRDELDADVAVVH